MSWSHNVTRRLQRVWMRHAYLTNRSVCILYKNQLRVINVSVILGHSYLKKNCNPLKTKWQFVIQSPTIAEGTLIFGRLHSFVRLSSWQQKHVYGDECGALMEWFWQGKPAVVGEKPVSIPLCPLQISHALVRYRGRTFAARGRWLTTQTMVGPLQF
jgi:hypothetical protein